MKRSESVLVYAVTAVLAVILVVAVVFGNEDPSRAGGAGAGGRTTTTDIAQLLDVTGFDDGDRGEQGGPVQGGVPAQGGSDAPGAFPDAVEPDAVEPDAVEPDAGEPLGVQQFAVPVGPLRAAAGNGGVAAILGAFELERSWNGELFRVYEVQRGETFSELVQRWTGDLDRTADVQALNEDVDLERLRVGQALRFPFVDDAELLLAREARRAATKPVAATTSRDVGVVEAGLQAAGAPAAPAAGAGTAYTIQKGDSLWGIAERQVGAGRAEAYVRAILAANPRIKDAGQIRAGDRIELPAGR
ncbi:MAG: LysM domain-containing protein [Planctomycetota bacterium]|nr:LysM domain-containing protein [Planctomycetota bacterium]